MRYALQSHGRVLGHTDLDIPCVTSTLLQGFIEPTEAGKLILPNATGVPRAAVACGRPNLEKAEKDAKMAAFMAACERREALELELRDEHGAVLACDFIRVYDLRDQSWIDEEISHDEGEPDSEFEADLQHDLETLAEREDDNWESAWPPSLPPDVRWDTMQYHVQVFLRRRNRDF